MVTPSSPSLLYLYITFISTDCHCPHLLPLFLIHCCCHHLGMWVKGPHLGLSIMLPFRLCPTPIPSPLALSQRVIIVCHLSPISRPVLLSLVDDRRALGLRHCSSTDVIYTTMTLLLASPTILCHNFVIGYVIRTLDYSILLYHPSLYGYK